jgi:hypothetical protein
MSTDQRVALTTQQLVAMSDQINQLFVTPIVLDLTGNGITTSSLANGVQFDLTASGQKLNTGWVTGGDGLLVLDRNHDGIINDGSELFGSATILPDGQKAANGYDALRAMDTNGDGVINQQDTGWSDLSVWVDANSDGVSQAGELKTLTSLGITQLNLTTTVTNTVDNGNLIGLVSSYETQDGVTHQMGDVWFAVSQTGTQSSSSSAGGLSANVSSLAETISSYSAQNASDSSSSTSMLANTTSQVTLAVGGMVGVLKTFDANGNPLTTTSLSQQVATPANSLSNTSALTNLTNGVLTTTSK